jgi:hypothetical protein
VAEPNTDRGPYTNPVAQAVPALSASTRSKFDRSLSQAWSGRSPPRISWLPLLWPCDRARRVDQALAKAQPVVCAQLNLGRRARDAAQAGARIGPPRSRDSRDARPSPMVATDRTPGSVAGAHAVVRSQKRPGAGRSLLAMSGEAAVTGVSPGVLLARCFRYPPSSTQRTVVRGGRVRLGRGRAHIQGERGTEPGQHHLAWVSSSGVDRERIAERERLAFLDDELDALRDQPGCHVAARLATS